MSESEYWAQLIREIRARGRMTSAQIAERIGVHERTVAKWLNGDRPTGLHALDLYRLHARLTDSPAMDCGTNTAR